MTRQRARIAAAILLALGAQHLGAQSAVDSVRSLDRAWARAYAVNDTATAQALFAPNIVITSSAGALKTREQELADVRPTPGLVMNYFRTENVDVHMTPRDAVVVGNAVWEFVMNGQTRNLRRRYTTTYARGGSLGWQMVALHLFPEPPVAASPSQPAPTGVEGRWEGALGSGAGRLRLALELSKAPDGLLLGTLTSIDQGGSRFPIDVARQTGDSIHLEWTSIVATYRGTISADRTRLIGTWSQGGQSSPLALDRSTGAVAATPPAAATAARPTAPAPFGILADVVTPMPPTPFITDGKTYLVYEVHITNFSGSEILLSRLDVLAGANTLATYEGRELNGILAQPRPNVTDTRSIPAGVRAVAYLWVTLDSGRAVPRTLRHRVSVGAQSLETPDVVVATTRVATVSPPLRGGDWLAANGPANTSGHRRALIALGGDARIAQRFAIDWVKVGASGATFSGNATDNTSYFAYGADILSVADGVVTLVKDSIPENVPGPTSRAVPITTETVGGNFVIVDIGSGNYAFYAHLKPGSLRVKVGDRVRRGQVLGLLGNSGNSTEPHLHFHIASANALLASEGLPYVIDAWEKGGAAGAWQKQRNQLPLLNVRARFP